MTLSCRRTSGRQKAGMEGQHSAVRTFVPFMADSRVADSSSPKMTVVKMRARFDGPILLTCSCSLTVARC